MSSTSVKPTNYPAIKNAPLAGLAEGNSYFSNYHLAAAVLVVPYVLKMFLPLFNRGGFKTYLFLLLLSGVPTTVAYWTLASMYGARKNEKVLLPGKDIEEYITIKDPELAKQYSGKNKIPMQVFYDAFFEGRIDIKGVFRVPRMRRCQAHCWLRRRVGDPRPPPRLCKVHVYARNVQACLHEAHSRCHLPLARARPRAGPGAL